MFLIKDHICRAGKDICEDAIGWGSHYLFAMDGASGLTGTHLMDAGSDAAWFASGIRDGLCRVLDGGDRRSTAEILLQLTAELRRDYEDRAAELGTEVPPDSPSAGIALFRELEDGTVEFFGLGDCVGALRTWDGRTLWSCDDALPALDGGVIARMAQLHQDQGCTVLEARRQCDALLLRNRQLRNTRGGYWILDPSGDGIPHARVLRWRREEVESLSAFSDGFAQLSAPFRIYPDYGKIHDQMPQTSLQALLEQVYTAQEADPDGNCFPRLKFRDDACALWAQVTP